MADEFKVDPEALESLEVVAKKGFKKERGKEFVQIGVGKSKVCQISLSQFGSESSAVASACRELVQNGGPKEAVAAGKNNLRCDFAFV